MPLLLLLLVVVVDVGAELLCPVDIKSFSTGAFENSYYKCSGAGAEPTLASCPQGFYYKASTRSCCKASKKGSLLQSDKPDNDDMVEYRTHVLGRPVMLGSVYDARNNQIYATTGVWSRDTVKKNNYSSKAFSSDVSFFAAQSTYDKMNNMDITATLKLEFMGGLVSVGGSAAYLKESAESENTVAFVLNAKYRTQTVMMPSDTKIDNLGVCNLKTATHVVTAITYGMDAYFSFKKQARSSFEKEKVKGDLQIAIKKIPSMKIDSSGSVEIDGSLAKKIEGIDAKLLGDFILKKQPTTYNESVRVFGNLADQLGEQPDYPNAAKMEMTLTPMRRFCDRSTMILLEISEGLMKSVTKMLDELEKTTLKAKTLSDRDVVKEYPPLGHTMNLFMTALDEYTMKIKSQLQKIIPKIRAGGPESRGEQELAELLTKYKKSPFSFERCRIFFITRSREIEVLNTIFTPEKFGKNIEVVHYEKAGDVKVMFEKNTVLTLTYNVIPDSRVMEQFINGTDVDESTAWFNNRSVDFTLSKAYRDLNEFAKANEKEPDHAFQVAIHPSKPQLVNLYAQNEKERVSDNFETPKKPSAISIIQNEFNLVMISVSKPSNCFINGFKVRQWKNGKKALSIETKYDFNELNIYQVKKLVPNQIYQFDMRYTTAVGNSPYSDESEYVTTRPCSPPANLQTVNINISSVTVAWDEPIHFAEGVQVIDYSVELYKDNVIEEKKKTNGTKFIYFENMEKATHYSLSVSAIAKREKLNISNEEISFQLESSKAWLNITTSPEAPSKPSLLGQVWQHMAMLTWDPPMKIATGSDIKEYRVQYHMTNRFNNKTLSSPIEVTTYSTSVTISDLVSATTYAAKVKVITTLGSSSYSQAEIFTTGFTETEVDRLRKSLEDSVKNYTDAAIHDLRSNAVQTYYSRYRLTYIGIGKPEEYDGLVGTFVSSLDACISYCHDKHTADAMWNGVMYESDRKACWCPKYDQGHKGPKDDDTNSILLHFRFHYGNPLEL